MGMFDYTYYKCPKCSKIVEEQSKAGNCSLSRYFFGDIAYELPKEIHGEVCEYQPAPLEIVAEASKYGLVCDGCGYKTKPVIASSYVFVPFGDEDDNDDEYYEED